MIIYVEYSPDEILIRRLTELPRRSVIQELKGKYEVLKRLSAQSDLLAVVHEEIREAAPGVGRSCLKKDCRIAKGAELDTTSGHPHRSGQGTPVLAVDDAVMPCSVVPTTLTRPATSTESQPAPSSGRTSPINFLTSTVFSVVNSHPALRGLSSTNGV